MSADDVHNRSKGPSDDDSDPVDAMLNKTGCADLHYAVQVTNFNTFN